MELEGSLLSSHGPITGSYSFQYTALHHIYLRYMLILSYHLDQVFKVISPLQVF